MKFLGWKIKRGYAPRGRTGDAVIKAQTKTTARHLRNGIEIGRREVHNKKVTTAFVNFLVDNLQTETAEWGDFKYHDSGTDNTAEDAANTGLGTPTGIARVTGTQVDGDSTNEYRSVGTITYDGSYAVVEHGLFSQSSGGTLMDRTVFTAINVVNSDQIEFTFDILFSAEA